MGRLLNDVIFWLGTHQPHWVRQTNVPLFISHRRLRAFHTLPRASGPVAIDSGVFTEIGDLGRPSSTPFEYAAAVRRYQQEMGNVVWAATQDWMCEPFMLRKTGLSVRDHQLRTIASYLQLKDIAPEVPWVPALQGWSMMDYVRHVDLWLRAGVDLRKLPLVGLGSVCRRQATAAVAGLVRALHAAGIQLHGFGVKTLGVKRMRPWLTSSDSMAWSFTARRQKERLPGHTHKNCANCLEYALQWRKLVA